ncbi:gamma-glutamyltransferase family protein [Actinoplanes bogorensis]|uniref:Gamma-glutamyltransferase family protein n=1 Tax=Paractinoplanes bogorensis TaxID=1610840 RepID=A0ABS5YSG9_9ACTN|nr:gamma-glutamyltransferase [Actinoplanes bogorensis]MBU2666401.1 gamma-glutamyltransferase family protein [Actinoplanes bogorensis]
MPVAVAAPHPAAVEAARTAVAAGGNAFDAALAAAGALAVVYPHQCSAGGDLVAMVRSDHFPVRAVLSIGAAALAVDVAGLGAEMPWNGPQTVTVPGVVAGWAAVHGLGARLPLDELLAPAIRLAADGVEFAPGLRAAIARGRNRIQADPGLAAVMLRPTLVQPSLAATLTAIGKDWQNFYTGDVGSRLVLGLRSLGSPLSTGDFAAHVAEVGEPLRKVIGEATWHAAPPPTQGATFLELVGSPTLLADSRRAQTERDASLGDPRSRTPGGDTVAVTAVDSDGNAVTLIQSVFESFGSGILEPSTGIVLHNRGASFRLDPAHPGHIAPGARPPHTLCPTMATTPDGVIALGCQGGRSQPWILAQVAADALTAADPGALVARPRWIIRGDELVLEPGVPTPSDTDGLTVSTTAGPHDGAGHVQLSRLRSGTLDAGSDPRADGSAALLT